MPWPTKRKLTSRQISQLKAGKPEKIPKTDTSKDASSSLDQQSTNDASKPLKHATSNEGFYKLSINLVFTKKPK